MSCTPARPVPVLSFRGKDDGIVPYFGGLIPDTTDTILSATATHDFWKTVDGCTGADQNQSLGSASCTTNSQCEGG